MVIVKVAFILWLHKGPQSAHPTLFQLRSFWFVVGLPIIIAVIVWFCIFKSLGYPDLVATYDGFNRAYEYFKIPLWIAALSLPLAGFYATNHRSVQTAAQIAESEKKNNFENTLKHQDKFYEKLELLSKKYDVAFSEKEYLYKAIFTKNSFDYFSPYCDGMDMTVNIEGNVQSFEDFFISFRSYVNKFNDCYNGNDQIDMDDSFFGYVYFLMRFLSMTEIEGFNYLNGTMLKALNFDRKGQVNKKFCFSVLLKISDVANELEVFCLSYTSRMKLIQKYGSINFEDEIYKALSPIKLKPVYRTSGLGDIKKVPEDEGRLIHLRLLRAYDRRREEKLMQIKASYFNGKARA